MLRSQLRSQNSSSSSESSPPTKGTRLNVAGVANIFIKMRRLEKQTAKPNHIVSSSGEPLSHPGVAENACLKKIPVELVDNYVCIGGVNVTTLLRATRGTLLDKIDSLGATSLINEQWKCTIVAPKHRSTGTFKVQIRYSASATRSIQPDPHRPVALEKGQGVPGLMTILKRNDD